MSEPPDNSSSGNCARASVKRFVITLIVRGLLIAALVLANRYFLSSQPTLFKVMLIWGAWAGADIAVTLLTGLPAAWTGTCLQIAAVAGVVILKIELGPYWIALWAAISAAWSLAKHRITALAIEGPATGERAKALLQFIRANGGRGVKLEVLAPGDEDDRMRAAYNSRRGTPTIYLTGNMLELMDDRELRTVVAHELAHHRRRTYGDAASFALRVAAVFLAGELSFPGRFGGIGAAEGLRGAPLVCMYGWLLGVLIRPVTLALSRRAERLANATALEMTDDPAAFISAMKKLAKNNSLTGQPGIIDRLLIDTHPSLDEVIRQAHRYAAGHGIELGEQDTGNEVGNHVC